MLPLVSLPTSANAGLQEHTSALRLLFTDPRRNVRNAISRLHQTTGRARRPTVRRRDRFVRHPGDPDQKAYSGIDSVSGAVRRGCSQIHAGGGASPPLRRTRMLRTPSRRSIASRIPPFLRLPGHHRPQLSDLRAAQGWPISCENARAPSSEYRQMLPLFRSCPYRTLPII